MEKGRWKLVTADFSLYIGTHPLAPSLKKRRGTKVPLFLKEGFRVSSSIPSGA